MEKAFLAVQEPLPGEAWRQRFLAGWPRMREWYLKEGLAPRPTVETCRAALDRHMPELLPLYERLCDLVGDDDIAHRCLSCLDPPPVITGCSQAVWLGEGGPALVRNYDFEVPLTSGCIEAARWRGRRVIAMSQRAWGALDGMNEDGLVASLTFGGSFARGRGFSMILVLRYLLETCRTVAEAVAALIRIPIPMSQNVTVLDRSGAFATVFLGPDRAPLVTESAVCTNHQDRPIHLQQGAAMRSAERQTMLTRRLADPASDLPTLVKAMFEPPVYRHCNEDGFATVYTAVYRPLQGSVEFIWPGKTWRQGFQRFEPGAYTHHYAALAV
ncbi:MAG TPA: C45 family autoproteolytic acyltransferase/hydrolase [Stellaceae bacterium]|nr:C45 family autoproteolytic acyltransferase/hydrolase [Stellaceae bacterium]